MGGVTGGDERRVVLGRVVGVAAAGAIVMVPAELIEPDAQRVALKVLVGFDGRDMGG
jgi:hypothetical protein